MFKEYEDMYDIEEMIEFLSEVTNVNNRMILLNRIITSHKTIQNYLNANDNQMLDREGKGKYPYEVMQMALFLIRETEKSNISSKKQGERTVTYHKTIDLPPELIELLPLPYVGTI